MTTNSPNPVDGDLQALIERLNRVAEKLKWHNVGYAQDILKAVNLLTNPTAQLLRPVDLSDCKKLWYDHDDLSAEIVCIPLNEIKKVLRQQGYEVKS